MAEHRNNKFIDQSATRFVGKYQSISKFLTVVKKNLFGIMRRKSTFKMAILMDPAYKIDY